VLAVLTRLIKTVTVDFETCAAVIPLGSDSARQCRQVPLEQGRIAATNVEVGERTEVYGRARGVDMRIADEGHCYGVQSRRKDICEQECQSNTAERPICWKKRRQQRLERYSERRNEPRLESESIGPASSMHSTG